MENTRQNFYQGQSVAPEHLNELQDYTNKEQANLISSLLGYGIVNGFELETIQGHIIGVSAGLAFNLVGERLVLTEGKQVNLVKHIPNTGEKVIKLGIILDYVKTEPVLDSLGNTVYKKWTPIVEFITGETLEGGIFELAEIRINPVSVVEIVKTSPNFATLPHVEEQLLHQLKTLNNKTLALTTSEDSALLTSPLLNLITQNLQINGTPYMEIGSNDNGDYVKFESGLLVCFGKKLSCNTYVQGWGYNPPFPHQFNTLLCQLLVDLEREYATPNYYTFSANAISSNNSNIRFNLMAVMSSFGNPTGEKQMSAKGLAIGFWK